jgi:hypothetical protein
VLGACGKKGPPLPPLNLIPEPPAGVAARRVGATVYIDMSAPKKNANGPGLVALDHIEVYGITVGKGLATPANRDLLSQTYLVGRIDIKPAVDEDEPVDDSAKEDTRPGPGDKVTFVEALTDKQLQSAPGLKPLVPTPAAATPGAAPAPSTPAPLPATTPPPATTAPAAPPTATAPQPPAPGTVQPPAPGTAAAPTPGTPATAPAGAPAQPGTEAAAAAASPPVPPGPVRVYVVRGVTRKGRPGPPSARVIVPLVPPPPAPGAPTAKFTEQAITLSWLAPVAAVGEAAPMSFNVYSVPASDAAPGQSGAQTAPPVPLNDAPLTEAAFEHAGAKAGIEQCFHVRTVEKVSSATLESEPSARVCVTPRDMFPPAAPKGLAVVAMEGGVMNLIWDANTESDLAGYLILRGEAPGETLQPLTPEPIHDTKFTDTGVKPGVRYVYAVVAVDRASPPNRSAPSPRVEETAR